MTKKVRRQLESALCHAKRSYNFIMSERVEVCHKKDKATTTLDYENKSGEALFPICKDIGSDLTGIEFTIRILEDLLEIPEIPPIPPMIPEYAGLTSVMMN